MSRGHRRYRGHATAYQPPRRHGGKLRAWAPLSVLVGILSLFSSDIIKAALAPTHKGTYYWCATPTGTGFFTKKQLAARNKACAD